MKKVKAALLWLAAIASAIAALLWWYASTRTAFHKDLEPGDYGYTEGNDKNNRMRDDDGNRIGDPIGTAEVQSDWNRRAAIAAAIAAGAQAIALTIPD
ncbi:hypothetical protein [Methylobacterium sp. J-076]|uniref:hypothetical protein n=1 Tax=Methylobacterium sp. J-076 TaxID=2836655 RepID=UPI001FBA00F6|nr:hypothetical protein [Methylobacterium sp. J-076]MCJ2011249.1 hypothetical protein [Methylobacterium sp. J-076]